MKSFQTVACNLSLTAIALLGLSGAGFGQGKSKSGEGAAIYKANCVLCHGSDGHAQTTLGKQVGALDLHSEAVQKKTDAELKKVITKGQKNMPAFGVQLTAAQINDVLAYVREFGKKK